MGTILRYLYLYFFQILRATVRGRVSERPIIYEVLGNNETVKIVHDQNFSLHRLAAKAKIRQLQSDDEGRSITR